MPYTISHVAAALPFARPLVRWGLLSAIIVGCVVPDFGYLMPSHPSRLETHSLLALVTFCLPVGLLSFWIFQYLLKTPLISVLADRAYMRWLPYAAPVPWNSPRQWLLAVVGVLVGAISHLAWDGFTHEDGRGVRMVPELADTLFVVRGHLVTGALLLQALSSLAGLAIVIGGIAYALRRGPQVAAVHRTLSPYQRRIWVMVYLGVTAAICVGFLILDPGFGAHRLYGVSSVAIALLRAIVPASLGIGALMTLYLRRRR